MLGGSDDLSRLIAENKLSQLLHEAQGKPALPRDLQAAVDQASKTAEAHIDAAFIPTGMSRDEYASLQELAASLEVSHHDVQW